MELADLKRRAQASRQFDADLGGGVVFQLRTPTKHEASIAYMESSSGNRATTEVKWQRTLLVVAVVGWSGVKESHVLGEGSDAIDFDKEATALLFDAQPQWEEALLAALVPKLTERQAAEDTAEKN